jgi:hypothetical protein
MRRVWAAALLLLGAAAPPPVPGQVGVEVLGTVELDPRRFDAGFGGISGIDYDPRQRRWLLLSDDRSDHAPARVYTVRIGRRVDGRWTVGRGRAVVLTDVAGAAFPKAGTGREAVDPEAIRIAPDRRTLLWASEGDAKDGYGPAVRRMDRRGRTIGQVPLPATLRLDPAGRRGVRDNGTIEGLDFTPDGALWLAMERPLIEDAPLTDQGSAALVRFTRLRDGQPARQFAYRLDPVRGQGADNGVSEILAIDDRRMLVIERSGTPLGGGRYLFHCRLYLADFSAATEIPAAGPGGALVMPAAKRLLLDFDTVADNPGNLEAMAWWPSGDGKRDHIVIANDNNFVAGEPTRLLLLSLATALSGSPAH